MASQELNTDPPLRNILLLDKSTAPLTDQIQEAFSILGIKRLPLDRGSDQDLHCLPRCGPREEWTLRWLLKKLEGSQPGPHSVFLTPLLWPLFQELILRVPVANLARLLRDHGFFNITLDTLRSLEEYANGHYTHSRHETGFPTTSISGESSGAADSSSATLETVPMPKKRRLGHAIVDTIQLDSDIEPDVQQIFTALCAVICCLQKLTKDDSHGYAVEHLKMAFRAPPELAAEMLGNAFTIAYYMLQTATDGCGLVNDQIFRDWITSWAAIWNLRSKKPSHDTVQLAFAAKCSVPALEVLTILDKLMTFKVDMYKTIDVLEDLLLQHVIIPARTCFECSKRVATAVNDEGKGIDLGDLLASLKNHISSLENQGQGTIHPVARFYAIIVKQTPCSTSKERIANSPWLQYMFNQILDQFPSPTAARAQESNLAQCLAIATIQMLKTLVDHDMKVGTATLERVLMQVSKLLGGASDPVNWEIIGLCLKIDPDVFVIPSSTNRGNSYSTRTPNKYLAALFARLNGFSESSRNATDEAITIILRNILVPLMKGFAHARDLLGFINHWKANLALDKKSTIEPAPPTFNGHSSSGLGSNMQNTECIWEHDDLLQAVADLVESHLTVGQIETLLQEGKVAIESASITSDPDLWLSISANLVIHDCVFSGCTNENTISKLSNTVQSIYLSILEVRKVESLPIILRWRAWRCIATIKNKWEADFLPNSNLRGLEKQAAMDALNIQKDINSVNDLNERLHSFHFLLSMIDIAYPPLYEALVEQTVRFVLSLLGRYAELVMSHLPEAGGFPIVLSQSSYEPSPENLKELAASQESTLLYASMLCERTAALSSVNRELQRKFIELLFECDLLDVRRMSRHNDRPFEYNTSWKNLLHWDILQESGSLLKTYRTFQLEKFSNPSYWRDQRFVSDNAVYASAFDNLHRIPAHLFSRKQQILILNKVVNYLVQGMLLGSQLLKDHAKLVTEFLTHPSKAFNILRHPTGFSHTSQVLPDTSNKPVLLMIAEQMHKCFSNAFVDTEAIELLMLLVRRVLDYQRARVLEEQTNSYLISYFESLIPYSNKVARIMHGDQHGVAREGESENTGFQKGDSDEAAVEDGYFQKEAEPVELNIYSIVVISASLHFYERYVKDFPASLQSRLQKLPSFHELRAPVLDALCQWIASGRGSFTKPISEFCRGALAQNVGQLCRAAAAQYVQAVYNESMLEQPLHASIGERIGYLATKASEQCQISSLNMKEVRELKEALRLLRKSQRLLALNYDHGPLDAYRKFEDTRNSISEQKQLVKIIIDSINNFEPGVSAELMTRIISQDNGNVLGRDTLLLLQSLIIRHIKTTAQSSEATCIALHKVVDSLCNALLQHQPYQVSVLSLHCVNIVLHKKPRNITQWHIDQIMAVIATSASRAPPTASYTPKQTGLQYLALCRVFSTTLAFHRTRLGGRYHLILLVLQALLRPLFIPYKSDLTPSAEIYSAVHASAYSRLLLQLADPPLSSVSNRPHKRKHGEHHSLNDSTKMAKSIAGQHLHYLIMTYCDCQLKGRLAQQVRDKLRPGIWAALDVIPLDAMRVMNAGMDKAGRAVWKGLHEEWKRDRKGR